MIPEAISRRPQEGTDRFKVYKEIESKPPPWDRAEIGSKTALTRKQVSIAIANLRNAGYLPRPTPKETRQSRQLALAHVLLPAKPYREMGMSIREIQLALLIREGKSFTYEQIHGAIGWGTKRGTLRKLSEEERQDIRKDSRMSSKEQVMETVSKWLMAADSLKDTTLFASRLEWKKAIEEGSILVSNLPKSLKEYPAKVQTIIKCADSVKGDLDKRWAFAVYGIYYFGSTSYLGATSRSIGHGPLTLEGVSKMLGITEEDVRKCIRFVQTEVFEKEWDDFEKTTQRNLSQKTKIKP